MSSIPWNDVRNAMKGDDGKTRVPDGVYDCKIATTKNGQTGSGYEKVNARFVVLSGPYEGGSIFMDFIVTVDKPGGLNLLGERLKALGITETELVDGLSMEALASMMVGRTATLTLATRVFNGKEYDDVKNMKPLAAPGGGFAFGGNTILPTVPSVPGTATGPVPTIVTPAVTTHEVWTPEAAKEVYPPAPILAAVPSGENGLPPEPPF